MGNEQNSTHRETPPIHLEEYVSLAPRTTLGLGGPARFYAEPTTEEELIAVVAWAERAGLPPLLLGGGSNLVVADEGVHGLILKPRLNGLSFCDEGIIEVGASYPWDKLTKECAQRDLQGIECLGGIPGSVGATPVQNVGA